LIAAHISELTFNDGSRIALPPNCVVVIVGPNNSGKSTVLREVQQRLGSRPGREAGTLIIKEVKVEKTGAREDAEEYITTKGYPVRRGAEDRFDMFGGQEPLLPSQFGAAWEAAPPFHNIAGILAFFAGAQQRLGLINAVDHIDYSAGQEVGRSLHALYRSGELEDALCRISEEAFGVGIVLHRFAGRQLRLHFGPRPTWRGHDGRPEMGYLQDLEALPQVQQQGDGVRSFLGLMLEVLVGDFFWLLVDEPEAFLHPPQARLLGRKLAQHCGRGRQVIAATHSTDVLQGLLSEEPNDVLVLRLTREGNSNPASVLTPEQVRRLWEDPLLRYSETLGGLFHEAVVLCEADTDCRFYSAVIEEGIPEAPEFRAPDVLWTHCGGKSRAPMVIDALRAVKVPIRVIADIDILRDEHVLQSVVGSLGGTWADFDRDFRVLTSAVASLDTPLRTDVLRQEMADALARLSGTTPTTVELDRLRSLLKASTGWAHLKRSGETAVPQGDATDSFRRLIAGLRSLGLFIVPVGELERFAPQIGEHGPKWLSGVLEQGLHRGEPARAARLFVRDVLESLSRPDVSHPPSDSDQPGSADS